MVTLFETFFLRDQAGNGCVATAFSVSILKSCGSVFA